MNLRVKELLKEKGVTSYQLAEHLGVTQSTVSNAMNGNPSVKWLNEVANFLDVDITELFKPSKDFIALIDYNGSLYHFDSIDTLNSFISNIDTSLESTPATKLRVKEICKAKGITQKQLAEKINVAETSLSKIIVGNPTIATLNSISSALGVEIVELFKLNSSGFTALIKYKGVMYRFDYINALKSFILNDESQETANN